MLRRLLNMTKLILLSFLFSLSISQEWTIAESFENNNFSGIPHTLSWTQGGNANWSIDTDGSE